MTNYFTQLNSVSSWRLLSEDTLRNDLMNLYGTRLPQIHSRNMKIRIIETLLQCRDGVCLLNYEELRQVIVEGKAMPSNSVAA